MADDHVWLRCCGCKGVTRLISFSGDWGLWNGVDSFVTEHIEKCFGDKKYAYSKDDVFFETVTSKQATKEGWWSGETRAVDGCHNDRVQR
jgi:hypothetical protein